MKTKVNNLQMKNIRHHLHNFVPGIKYETTWDIFVPCVSLDSDEKSTCNKVVLIGLSFILNTDRYAKSKRTKKYTRSFEQRLERS